MRDLDSPPLWRFIWPAALLHAGAIGFTSLVPVDSGHAPSAPAAQRRVSVAEVEVDVVSVVAESVDQGVLPLSGDGEAPGARVSTPAALARLARPLLPRGDERLPPEQPADGVAGAARIDGTHRAAPGPDHGGDERQPGPTLSLEQLGITPGRVGRAILPHRRVPAARSSAGRSLQQSMASDLQASDRERGLGVHGPLIAAFEAAARTESTPANGRAQFLVGVDEQGRVVSVEVLEVTSEYRAWQRAARRARRALIGNRVRLPEGAKGVQMRLEIASRVQRPSGLDPGLEVSLFGIPLKRAEGERPSRLEMFDPIPKLDWVEVPDPGTGEMRKLPQVQISFVPLALGFDPADIGAPTRRVVEGRVVDVNVL
jgi:hypothetical protein